MQERMQEQAADDRETVARQRGATPSVGVDRASAPKRAEQAAREADADVRQEMAGAIKEKIGELIGSDKLEAEGEAQQRRARREVQKIPPVEP